MTACAKQPLPQSVLIFAVLLLVMPASLSCAESSAAIQNQVNPTTPIPIPVTPARTVNSVIKQISKCEPDKIGCLNACVDPKTDPSNCGTCGHVCPSGQICNQGSCACPSGLTFYGGRCVDLQTDYFNCGAGGKMCVGVETCLKGACICPSPNAICGGKCVDLRDNIANCGGCGQACGNAGKNKSRCYQSRCTNDK